MITTQIIPYRGIRTVADELNRESARHYNAVLTNHWRTYRKKAHWLSERAAYRWEDRQSAGTTLHAHSRDAAQQAFYRACSAARELKKQGYVEARYPKHRRSFRTTIWKSTGIRRRGNELLLARARGLSPVAEPIPAKWSQYAVKEARLVFNRVSCTYAWHIVLDDGLKPPDAPGDQVLAVDMGEVHPAVVIDAERALVVSCRALRACTQYGNKRRAELASLRDRRQKGSKRRLRVQRRMNRFAALQERRQRDILHKVSRAVVDQAVVRGAKRLVIGDVRDIADEVDLGKQSNQKVSGWTHGHLRQYITYKAERVGIEVVLQNERYTSQTCPVCGQRKKPNGRIYQCGACGGVFHRDVVGAVNILSTHLHGEPGHIAPPTPMYRRPFVRTLRSRADTPDLARNTRICAASERKCGSAREVAGFNP